MLVLSAVLIGCRGGGEETAAVSDVETTETISTSSGLECLVTDEMESGEYEAAMADAGSGHSTIEDAVKEFWSLGDGAWHPDKDTLIEELAPPVARYRNEAGHVRLIVRFESINNRWLLSSLDSCFTAADWADDGLGSADRTGGGVDGPVFFYRQADESGEQSEIVGVLTLQDGCLHLVDDGFESLVLWELGTEWESGLSAVVLADGAVAEIGSNNRGVGGFHPVDRMDRFTASSIVQAALDECAAGRQIEVAVFQGDSVKVVTG